MGMLISRGLIMFGIGAGIVLVISFVVWMYKGLYRVSSGSRRDNGN
jgi:hypothetical protein